MPNYAESKIYKLICNTGYYYIGSTTSKYLSTRYANHKVDSKRDKYANNKVYSYINNIGWDNVRIVLLESVSCLNKDELKMKENEYIIKSENDCLCLNSNRAFLNNDERKERNIQCKKYGSCKTRV